MKIVSKKKNQLRENKYIVKQKSRGGKKSHMKNKNTQYM